MVEEIIVYEGEELKRRKRKFPANDYFTRRIAWYGEIATTENKIRKKPSETPIQENWGWT